MTTADPATPAIEPGSADAPAAEPLPPPPLQDRLRVARRELRKLELLEGPWRRYAQALDLQDALEATKRHDDAKRAAARSEAAAAELRKLGIDPFTGERLIAAKAEETSR